MRQRCTGYLGQVSAPLLVDGLGREVTPEQVGMGGAALSGRVRERKRRLGLATRLWRAMEASTLFFDTFRPPRRSARTRGEP